MGGFEGADHVNGQGVNVDMVASNGHVDRLDEDYRAAAALGIRTVRESVGWRSTEPACGKFDFTRLHATASAARRHGVQVLWTFMHYGVPADLSLVDERLVDRFTAFATSVAEQLMPYDDTPVYNMINEIGFLAWAVSETNLFHPHRGDPLNVDGRTIESGYAVKRRLVRAVLSAMAAIHRVDPRVRFMHVEPMVHLVAPVDRPELEPLAAQLASYQWQVWDMIEGRADPELGGHRAALDLIGINHYHSGQWEVETGRRLEWHLQDPRRKPLRDMLGAAWQRYRRPLLLAETSHFGEGRSQWLDEIMVELLNAERLGTPVLGVCLYPLVDRPDWENPGHWHHSGLWDVDVDVATDPPSSAQRFPRRLNVEYAGTLARWQAEREGWS